MFEKINNIYYLNSDISKIMGLSQIYVDALQECYRLFNSVRHPLVHYGSKKPAKNTMKILL